MITTLEAEIARMQAAMREAREALEGLLSEHNFIDDREHWERERELGNGTAPLVLAAVDASATLTTLLSEDLGEGEPFPFAGTTFETRAERAQRETTNEGVA